MSNEDINHILLNYAPKKEEDDKAQYEAKSRVLPLSGGQKRLLTIIANVVIRESASLFLIDEPMNNLDSFNMVNVSNLINSIRHKHPKAAFLLVTHCRVFPFITRRINIKNGRIDSVDTNSDDLKHYDCLGLDVNEEGFYKLPK